MEVVTDSPQTKEVSTKTAAPMPAMTQSTMPTVMSSQELVTFAVMNDKVEMLDKIIALKNAEEDRAAKIEFDRHFAEMQKDYEPVRRSTKGQFGVFADLNAILSTYGPILARHGFSTSWEEEEIPEKPGWKRIWNLISGYGYTKRAKFDCPPAPALDGGAKGANVIQLQGIQTSYGKRYSFNSNAGVILTDEDKDGGSFEDGVKLGQYIQLIREATTQAERKTNFMAAIAGPDLTDREKVILGEESVKRSKELKAMGVTE
ncbi:ERF family protein [Tetrasphaera phage TJE1]|uniref:ERF family protein n=1 Tax=Tetrasphaera phage TJE1 TaxID=981335 RepID=G4W985_9CAUD|nr:ERF family protein [Tetrasphaera phage TJE1]ADX42573.1 ERF family protein [Tetrasphaera phage TJE1]